MHFRRTTAAATALAFAVAVAAGCGSASSHKRPLHLEGNTIVLDDGRTIELRVWDSSINCFRPLSSWADAELTKPEPQTSDADLFLDLTVDRDCVPSAR
jgi:hypothetical protein